MPPLLQPFTTPSSRTLAQHLLPFFPNVQSWIARFGAALTFPWCRLCACPQPGRPTPSQLCCGLPGAVEFLLLSPSLSPPACFRPSACAFYRNLPTQLRHAAACRHNAVPVLTITIITITTLGCPHCCPPRASETSLESNIPCCTSIHAKRKNAHNCTHSLLLPTTSHPTHAPPLHTPHLAFATVLPLFSVFSFP